MSDTKESLFISILRSFFKGFFSFIGIFFALFLFIIFSLVLFMGKETISSSTKHSIEILPDLKGNSSFLPMKTPVILQIDINGIIGLGDMKSELVEKALIESRKDILKEGRVKGILLHMNTRGGSVIDSDNIYRMLLEYKEKYKVPIYAYIDGINASGGVYISCAADEIYASPVSIIGSVGVLSGPFMNFYKTLEKIGVESLTLTKGKDKDALNPFRPWKEDESSNMKMISDYYYNMFVEIVIKARPKITKEKLISTYGAHVFPSPIAEKYGYIDHSDANYNTAMQALLKKLNIAEDSQYQIIKIKTKKKIMEELFENSSLFKGTLNHNIKIGSSDNEIKEKFSFLYLSEIY